jgi:hypothetical protein
MREMNPHPKKMDSNPSPGDYWLLFMKSLPIYITNIDIAAEICVLKISYAL